MINLSQGRSALPLAEETATRSWDGSDRVSRRITLYSLGSIRAKRGDVGGRSVRIGGESRAARSSAVANSHGRVSRGYRDRGARPPASQPSQFVPSRPKRPPTDPPSPTDLTEPPPPLPPNTPPSLAHGTRVLSGHLFLGQSISRRRGPN